jgi:hypothetical protein
MFTKGTCPMSGKPQGPGMEAGDFFCFFISSARARATQHRPTMTSIIFQCSDFVSLRLVALEYALERGKERSVDGVLCSLLPRGGAYSSGQWIGPFSA